jgi:hypothetical protein
MYVTSIAYRLSIYVEVEVNPSYNQILFQKPLHLQQYPCHHVIMCFGIDPHIVPHIHNFSFTNVCQTLCNTRALCHPLSHTL